MLVITFSDDGDGQVSFDIVSSGRTRGRKRLVLPLVEYLAITAASSTLEELRAKLFMRTDPATARVPARPRANAKTA